MWPPPVRWRLAESDGPDGRWQDVTHARLTPDDFSDAVLALCPGMGKRNAARLREKVREGFEGHPVGERKTRFADVIIDHRHEAFARPFVERSVERGVLAGS